MIDDRTERAHDLAAFANAAGQPNQPMGSPPSGHTIARQTAGLTEQRVFGAQQVAIHRDEQKVLQKLKALAAAAGSDWTYRFPARTKEGGQSWIEGPSIKLANDIARVFGNCAIEVRELDVGDAFVFYARFSDIETGFSMERAYRQRKSQTSMRTRDADRQLDIAYQIGQSKAIRNVIVNALQIYADYAFEEARNSLIDKIGKDLDGWRKRTLDGLARLNIDVARVERVVGRAAKDWLAPNVAQVIAMTKSIVDGMAALDEMFPPLESSSPADPKPHTPAGEESVGGEQEDRTAASTQGEDQRPATPAAADDDSTTEVRIAYERGKAAKATGVRRTALPGEYRDDAHKKKAEAWHAGWDGKPMPGAML